MVEKEEVNNQSDFDKWRMEVFGISTDEDLRKASEIRNLFDVDTIVKHSEKVVKLTLPTLGAYINIKPLRIIDNEAILSITHPNQNVERNLRNRMKIWKLVERVKDHKFTKENIDNLPANVVDIILTEYQSQEEERFLLPVLRRRQSGLTQTLEPSKS